MSSNRGWRGYVDTPCWTCAHWGGEVGPLGRLVWCADGQIVKSQPERGCVHWAERPPSWVAPPFERERDPDAPRRGPRLRPG